MPWNQFLRLTADNPIETARQLLTASAALGALTGSERRQDAIVLWEHLAEHSLRLGLLGEALAYSRAAYSTADALGVDRSRVKSRALLALCVQYRASSHHSSDEQAMPLFQEAITIVRELDNAQDLLGWTLLQWGKYLVEAGATEQAEACFQEVIGLGVAIDDETLEKLGEEALLLMRMMEGQYMPCC